MLIYCICTQYSFCINYCLNLAWHGGDQFVALLRWYGSPGFFDSGFQLICIFWSLVSHFLLDNTDLVSLLASQAHQHHGHLTNFWCFWQCGQVPYPAGKWNQYLQKAGQQKEAWSVSEFLRKCVKRRWFSKSRMNQHQQMTWQPKSSQTVET